MRTATVLLFIFFHTAAFASGIETVIGPLKVNLQAGQSTVFTVYLHNSEDTSVQMDIPNSIVAV